MKCCQTSTDTIYKLLHNITISLFGSSLPRNNKTYSTQVLLLQSSWPVKNSTRALLTTNAQVYYKTTYTTQQTWYIYLINICLILILHSQMPLVIFYACTASLCMRNKTCVTKVYMENMAPSIVKLSSLCAHGLLSASRFLCPHFI